MRDTSREPLVGAIVSLALPSAAAFLLQNAYHQNDAWFLGKVGPVASNAMGLNMMVLIAVFGVILVFARGTQSLVGRRLGAGAREGATAALAQGLGLALRIVLPFGFLLWLFAPELLAALGGEPETVEAGTSFLRTITWFMPFLFAQPILNFAFQALGDARTPFLLEGIALVVNTALNWALVLPHEGFGGWGVPGAAFATGVSRVVSASLGFSMLVRRHGCRGLLRRDSYRLEGHTAREILRVGLPAGASTLLYSFVGMSLLGVIGRFGQDAYGAYFIGFRGIESVSFMLVLGLGAATGTVVSHAVGAGDLARARRAGHVGAWLGVGAMGLTSAVFLLAPRWLVSLYTSDPEIIEAAAGYIRAMGCAQVFQALEMAYTEAMAGAGSSLRTAAISIPGNLLRIPLAWWLAVGLGLGLPGVWYAIIASAVIKGVGVSWLYRSGRWEQGMLRGRQALEAT